jgi:hypothetical protein
MAIVRWDPFREMSDMQDRMGRLLGEFYGRRGADDVMRRGAWIPPVDIYDSGKQELVIKAELPDMQVRTSSSPPVDQMDAELGRESPRRACLWRSLGPSAVAEC